MGCLSASIHPRGWVYFLQHRLGSLVHTRPDQRGVEEEDLPHRRLSQMWVECLCYQRQTFC